MISEALATPDGSVLITASVNESPEVAFTLGACTLPLPLMLLRCATLEAVVTGMDGLNAGGVKKVISGLAEFCASGVGATSVLICRSFCVGRAAVGSNFSGAFGASMGLPKIILGSFRSTLIFRSGGEDG